MSLPTLECGHCGDVAIESNRDGLFYEDTGDKCETCGMPGSVAVDDDGDDTPVARWNTRDAPPNHCVAPDCTDSFCVTAQAAKRASAGAPK